MDENQTEIPSLALHYRYCTVLHVSLCIDCIYCSIPGVSKETYTAYLNLFNLVGLDSLRWREDMFNRAMMAVALLKILKATNYFPQKSDADSFTSDEVRFVLCCCTALCFTPELRCLSGRCCCVT